MIYIVENEYGHVKIGYSRDRRRLTRRICALNTGSSRGMKRLAVGEGTLEDENGLHKLLRQFHIKREWFGYQEWMDPLMDNVIRLLPQLGAKGILEHTEDNLRNFVSFPCVMGPSGFIEYPERWKGLKVTDVG